MLLVVYTSGELPIRGAEKAALLSFVRSGRGFLGVHSATDTFYTWPDYLDLIGGYFNGHPWHQAVTIEVTDPGDSLVAFLGNSLQFEDEIYQISNFDYRGSHVLLRLAKARWTLASRACIIDSTAGLSPGPDLPARGEYFIRRLGRRMRAASSGRPNNSQRRMWSDSVGSLHGLTATKRAKPACFAARHSAPLRSNVE
jgi:trehalose utilization protein